MSDPVEQTPQASEMTATEAAPVTAQAQLSTKDQLLSILKQKATKGKDEEKSHQFWSTQPVLQMKETSTENCPIDAVKTVADVKQDEYSMPAGFKWVSLDVNDPAQLTELYNLLSENYVEDDDCMFRFDYPEPFLKWALTPPGYSAELHVGVRTAANKLVGFISGIPSDIRVHDKTTPMVEINFLCVHKKLRAKRLAPVLIKEVTRRVNLQDRWQAVYTAGVVLPKPVARCQYWHRSLNPKKLIESRFSRLPQRLTMAMTIRLYKLNDMPHAPLRPLTEADLVSATTLLNNYLQKMKLAPVLSVDDMRHWCLPREGVINSYVLTNESGEVTDMCSFYHLPSSIIGNKKYDKLNAAYSYYNVATAMSLEDLMRDALILARNSGADVFNALDLMENKTVFEALKFGIGDGHLQYYLYNWKCPEIEPNEVGLVLL